MPTSKPLPTSKKDVLVISSHVVAGAVGNRAMVFALERLGHTVWALPTVILPRHPGHGPVTPVVPADAGLESLAAALIAMPALARIGGVVTGYFADAAQVGTAARLVAAVKAANPEALYLCDPVIGDAGAGAEGGGRLYVAEDIAIAIRDRLLPLADVATPNRFECAWLSGTPVAQADDASGQARGLGPGIVVVTSHPALIAGQVGNLMVAGSEMVLAEHRRIETPVKGSGDLFAALVLAHLLGGARPAQALEAATSSVFEVIAAAAHLGADELPLAAAQEAIVRPRSRVSMRSMGPAVRTAGVGR